MTHNPVKRDELKKVIHKSYGLYHVISNLTFLSFLLDDVVKYLESKGVEVEDRENW